MIQTSKLGNSGNAKMWISLVVITLSKTNQTKKGQTFCDSTSKKYPNKSNSKTESRMWFPGVEESWCFMDAVLLGVTEFPWFLQNQLYNN